MSRAERVLWLLAAVVALYTVFSVATMHQCDEESQASPSYTRGDDNFDCRTMGERRCSDTGSGQGGRYWTPGYYNAYGQWERGL